MITALLALSAIALYLAATVAIVRRIDGAQTASLALSATVLLTATAAWAAHAAAVVGIAYQGGSLDLGLPRAGAAMAAAVVLVYLVSSARHALLLHGAVVLPVAALALAALALWPDAGASPIAATPAFAAHFVTSLLAYALLALAAIQSVVLAWQESGLRHGREAGLLRALPPLQSTERLLFQWIGWGFALLTLSLVTGVGFSQAAFGRPAGLTHHVVFSALAWIVFAALLAGRWRFGWRGPVATRWTLAGFVLVVLGYFGTKFVLEILLGR
jgi:ABC-type uncharacterized transport system permease subunit